jgi:PKD repeat protein
VTSGSTPLSVQFNDSSRNATSWIWNFGDGDNSTQQNPMHIFSAAGNYTVNLIVSNVYGMNSHLATINVNEDTPIGIGINTSNVSRTTPTITWSNPANITYGTALNGIQLNAASSVPGNFVYTPGSGTVLSAGIHILHVDFTPTDTANYSNTSKNVIINVNQATPPISWNNPEDIIYGTALNGTQLNAISSAPGNFDYTPENGTVLSAGTKNLKVEFTPIDTANYTTASANVTINVLNATPAITWDNPADIFYGIALTETQLNAISSVSGNFVYTPDNGSVLSAGTHTLHVDFRPDDSTNYTTVSKNVRINITKSVPEITWNNPEDIIYGTALNGTQLNAISSAPGNFDYTPENGTILSAGTKNLKVEFTPIDTANYTTASANVTINVLNATPAITWDNPADIFYGIALTETQLNAISSVSGNFVYTPDNGSVLSAGTHTLHVDFRPDDSTNYTTVSKNVRINITKSVPEIIWNNPEDIIYGTALNGTQLNAISSASGNFDYTPENGTVLSAGTKNLKVEFTPIDTANYTTASANVTINVLNATPAITWDNPADIFYGIALTETQLNAISSVSGNFVYTPGAGTVLSVGRQTLHVYFEPADTTNYTNASKDVAINVLNASYSIFNSVIGIDETGDCILDAPRDVLKYRIVVKNEGNTSLTNVNVTDSLINLIGPIGNSTKEGMLYPGETWIYTGSYSVTEDEINNGTAYINNIAKVRCDQLPEKISSVSQHIVRNANLSIYKSVTGIDEAGDHIINEIGDIIQYQVAVKNNGNVDFTGVSVDDPMISLTKSSGNHNDPRVLNPGETWVYTGYYTVKQQDIDSDQGIINNTATVRCDQLANESSSLELSIIRVTNTVTDSDNNNTSSKVYPVADFITSVTSGYAPLSIQFTDKSTGTSSSWSWDFNGDGVIDSSAQNPVYVYKAPGTYTAKLTVSNANGSDSKSVTINSLKVSSSSSGSSRDDGISREGSLGKAIIVSSCNNDLISSSDNTSETGILTHFENNSQGIEQNNGSIYAYVNEFLSKETVQTSLQKKEIALQDLELFVGFLVLSLYFCIGKTKVNKKRMGKLI